jgi:Zn-dependent protease with chaperone function
MTLLLARSVYYSEIHLLYASLVWIAAWVLTSAFRASATTKYWIWVATSLNFVIPIGAIVDAALPAYLKWARPVAALGDAGLRIADHAAFVGLVWLAGAVLMAARLHLRILAERRVFDSGPVVNGLLRPHISLPDGIEGLLTASELDAVLLHEQTHARRRDNLIRLVHELALCLLWFHPLLWITGSRLAIYRELSCDDSVIDRAKGVELVSALAKLADPDPTLLLQASASSLIRHRLARLTSTGQRASAAANCLLIAAFAAVIALGVFSTVSHTACCFITRSANAHR